MLFINYGWVSILLFHNRKGATTLSKMTLCIMGLFVTLSIIDTFHTTLSITALNHNAECWAEFFLILNVVRHSVVMLKVVAPNER